MDNKLQFAVKVEDGRKGHPSVGPVYRNILSRLLNLSKTTWDVFRSAVEKYPNNRMLGWRELVNDKEVLHAAYAIRASGIQSGCKVGIYGSNCPQWIVAMEACNGQSLICVPLYDTLGAGAVNLEHAEIDIVFVQDKKVKQLLDPDCTHTRRLKGEKAF
ncbi:hypothetical protein L1987_28987 [Smallanthus sonchifolius]|uniref:Uncharacterized protein n=1 Tax=Smallanthus sonchifolius TaxID=185202 RepID=A0ACB9HY49_9ASTR|nr:hypothetical protein L1987_28987 [Smallanthus sonchifolius]